MRFIHYDMVLTRPYKISCNPDIRNIDNVQASEAIKWPGIRMIVEDCENVEKFYASFEYGCVDGIHPKFERQLAQVLRGELPEWKLATVDVDNDELRLGFRNERLFNEYTRKCQDIETQCRTNPQRYLSKPPQFYSESVTSYRPDVGAKLRFEIDDSTTGQTSVVLVSFGVEYENHVIEFDENKGREFTFRHFGRSLNQYPVGVEEWMI